MNVQAATRRFLRSLVKMRGKLQADLSAAQIVTASHRMFGVALDLRDAFDDFTIESLARRVDTALLARVDD